MGHAAANWKVLNCRFYENPSPWNWQSSQRFYCNLWIAAAGEGELRLNGIRRAVRPGTAFLILPGDEISGRGAGEGRRIENFAAHFLPDPEDDGWRDVPDRINGRSFAQCLWLIPLLRDLSRDLSLYNDPDNCLAGERLQAILHLLSTEPDRIDNRRGDRLIASIVEQIRSNPAATYSVSEMADGCGLSASRFTKRFREMVGLPPNRFMVAERLRTAEMMLLGGNAPIETIADRLGYRDVYFFSRQFRQHRGISPSAYRRSGALPAE